MPLRFMPCTGRKTEPKDLKALYTYTRLNLFCLTSAQVEGSRSYDMNFVRSLDPCNNKNWYMREMSTAQSVHTHTDLRIGLIRHEISKNTSIGLLWGYHLVKNITCYKHQKILHSILNNKLNKCHDITINNNTNATKIY